VRETLTAVKYSLILSFSQREKDLALYVEGKTYGKLI
jgi:hypothetical protein